MRGLTRHLGRGLSRQVLGTAPDPESWPEPKDIHTLRLPDGLAVDKDGLVGWVLSSEVTTRWPHRRTPIGAQAFRLAENGEYDCGWRLVDLADRFIRKKSLPTIDMVTIVPPAPVFRPVAALEWCAERLARRINASFRPDLVITSAPLADHADRLTKRPVPWGELFRLERPQLVFNKRVLLVDWRWEKGKSMWALSKLLRHAGAEVVCFTWLG